MEHHIKMDDLGVPLFSETPMVKSRYIGDGKPPTFKKGNPCNGARKKPLGNWVDELTIPYHMEM